MFLASDGFNFNLFINNFSNNSSSVIQYKNLHKNLYNKATLRLQTETDKAKNLNFNMQQICLNYTRLIKQSSNSQFLN